MADHSPHPPGAPPGKRAAVVKQKRRHAAAATRILVAGVAAASTFGIVGAFRFAAGTVQPASISTRPASVAPASTPPVKRIYRYVPVPAETPSGSPASTGSTATPRPATTTRGS